MAITVRRDGRHYYAEVTNNDGTRRVGVTFKQHTEQDAVREGQAMLAAFEKEENHLIDTPYGKKRWGFLKRCMDSHENLLEVAEHYLETLAVGGKTSGKTVNMIRAAIANAKGGAE